MMANLVLIGFMGSGKTTIGYRLARTLGWRFIDTDTEIEKLTGLTITQLFIKHGEIRFRSEEALTVKKVAKLDRTVIATGGGVPLNKENVRLLKNSGILIWLKASPEIVLERIGHSRNRPLLRANPTLDDIQKLFRKREEYYSAAADIVIETGGKTHEQVVEEILAQVEGKIS